MNEENFFIEGFVFDNEEDFAQAKKEYQYINKIKAKLGSVGGKQLADFYEKLLERRIFTTQIGYTFLYEIRSTLVDTYGYATEELPVIELPSTVSAKTDEPKEIGSPRLEDLKEEVWSLKRTRAILLSLVIVLLIVIGGFFTIIATNDNVGYINTENKILNKYSQWEEDLKAKEQELNQREEDLKNGIIKEKSVE
ncbi:MAG: hypothetical protein IKQ71_03975 [Lachnospiraceae bacterium]|nr:hypothetical protein [Lachnospiraceae bacterium]